VVGQHELDHPARQISATVELAAVENHLGKTQAVIGRADEAGTALEIALAGRILADG
jgi:hypothetical protein